MHNDSLVPNPFKKWPRNLPCFCGSGEKFKKCCESNVQPTDISYKEIEQEKLKFNGALQIIQKLKDEGITFKVDKKDA